MGAATQMSNDPRENYEREWENILGLVQHHIRAGERSLSRVLRLVEAEWRRMDLKPARSSNPPQRRSSLGGDSCSRTCDNGVRLCAEIRGDLLFN
jgi:hypothetical protein